MPSLPISARQYLYYREHNPQGDPTVLLLHGLGANGSSWHYQIPCLEQAGFQILAPDARGFGRSSYPGKTSVALMTADIATLLQSMEISQVHVVGLSMGGTLALQFALDYPHLVDRLVLVNTFARLRPDNLRGWLYFLSRFTLIHTVGIHRQAQIVARRVFPAPEQAQLRQELIAQIHQANPRGYRAAMRALGLFDVEKRLLEIQAPTLVITGEKDNTVSLKNQKNLAMKIPQAQHIVIPGGGHAVTVDQSEAFNQVLLEFLTN